LIAWAQTCVCVCAAPEARQKFSVLTPLAVPNRQTCAF